MLRNLILASALSLGFLAHSAIRINEVVADNDTGHMSELGENSDWVELYNTDPFAVNLTGYYLSDDETLPSKWQLPNVSIPANGYLVVIASSANTVINGEIHTNFSISKNGETLVLSDDMLVQLDLVAVPEVSTDISYSRNPLNSNEWYYAAPTFGLENELAPTVQLEQPISSHTAGFYPSAIQVQYTCPDSLAEAVQIDFDYNVVSVLNTSISINSNTVIRTACRNQDNVFSDAKTDSYFINENSTLPVISLSADVADFNNMYNTPEQNIEIVGHAEMFNVDGTEEFEQDLEIELHGSATRYFAMKSLRLTAKNSVGKSTIKGDVFEDRNYDEFKQLILRNSGNDFNRLMYRDLLNARIARETNVDWQAGQPALVFVNGAFQGLYNIRERNRAEYITSLHGVEPEDMDYLENHCGIDDPRISNFPDGEVREGDNTHFANLFQFVDNGGLLQPGGYDQFKQWFDIDNYIDYYALQMYHTNWDWPYNNVRMWRPRTVDGKWRFIYYDTDFSLYLFGEARNGFWVDEIKRVREMTNNPHSIIFNELLKVEEFKCDFKNRLLYLMSTTLSAQNYHEKMDELEAEISPEIARQQAKYNNEMICCRNTVKGWVNQFIDERPSHMLLYVQDNLGSYTSTSLNVTPANAGTIVWNNNTFTEFPAATYEGCTGSTLLAVANEDYRFVQWSNGSTANPTAYYANATAEFEVYTDYGKLIVSEFMYNTDDNNTGDEWVEIYNPGLEDLDISNWVMKDDDDLHAYTIPNGTILTAGSTMVIAADLVAFNAMYPGVTAIGPFTFGFGNGGDQIRFYDASASLKFSLTYDDSAPWPSSADGNGTSVSVIDASNQVTDASNYMAGCYQGTPGNQTNCICTPVDLGNDITSCDPVQTLTNPISGASSAWYKDGVLQASTTQFTTSSFGTYSLVVIDAGCMSEDEIEIVDAAQSNVALNASLSTICGGETVTFTPAAGTPTGLTSYYGVNSWSINGNSVDVTFANDLNDTTLSFTVTIVDGACNYTSSYTTATQNCNLVCDGMITTSASTICGGDQNVVFTFSTSLTETPTWNVLSGIDSYTINGNTLTASITSNVNDATSLIEANVIQGNCNVSDSYISDLSACTSSSCDVVAQNSTSNWTLRNDWNDAGTGSTLANVTGGIAVNHRAWGFGNYWMVYMTPFDLVSGENYDVSFDYKDNNGTLSTQSIEAVFSQNLNWNAPATQTGSTISGPFSSTAAQEVSTSLNASASGNHYLAFKIDFGNTQVNAATTVNITNLKVCGATNIKVAEALEDQVYEITVVNIEGKIIYHLAGLSDYNLNFRDFLESGVYIVKIASQSELITNKIVIE